VDRRNYHIARPAGTKIRVGYAVDASWEPPLTKPVEDPIVDFGPNANCPEAYRLSATIGSGLMPGCGFAPYQVDAYDHQGADTVAAATFEAPDLFDGIITDLQGTDMGTFTRFEGTLPNSLEAVEGEYRVLVGVVDTETDPFLGDMTAYTMTVATVEPAPIDYEHGWRKQGKTLDNHNHNIYETEILPDLHEVWTYQFSAAAYSLFESTPTIGESAVYYVADVPYAQEIWALPLHGGDALWHRLIKFAPDMFNYRSTPTVGNCEVYVGGSSLFCLDSEDGDVIWIETAENEPFCNGSPVVVDDILVAWSTRNALYGFNAYSGSPMWVYSNGAETGNPATPVVDNGVVYAGDIKGNAFALSLEDGHELWKVQFDIGGPITSNAIYAPPVLAGGLIWFGSWNCRLYGLDPLTGGVVRDVDLGEQLPCESAAFDGTRLYQPLAYFPPYATFFTPPYRLLAITPDGTVEWEFPGEDDEAFFSTPVVANGVVWVVSDAGMIYMLDPATGDQVGSGPYALDHSVHGGMSIQDGRLYVTDDGGKMYCLE
jgi:outer membrane protein assembly factor BamB